MLLVLNKLLNSTVKSMANSDGTIKCILPILLNIIKLLQYSHKHVAVSRELLDLSISIASLPWIGRIINSNSRYAAMVPTGHGWNLTKLKQLANAVGNAMDPGLCLEVLCLFSPEFSIKWRVCVFKETLVREIRPYSKSYSKYDIDAQFRTPAVLKLLFET